MTDKNRGMVLGLLGVCAFGLTLPVTRYALPYMDPLFIGLGRALVAGLVAASLLIITRQSAPSRRQLGRLLLVALGVVIGFPVLSAWAMLSVPASHGGVVLGLLPLATALAAVIFGKERPAPGFWVAAAAGSMLVATYSLLQGEIGLMAGDWALLGATLCAALGYAVGGELSRELGGWQVICWALVLSLPWTFVPSLLLAPEALLTLPGSAWGAFFYLALVSQLGGFFLWNRGLALGGVARVSQTQLLQPFVTILVAIPLLGEALEGTTLLFALLVVIRVAIGGRMRIVSHQIQGARK